MQHSNKRIRVARTTDAAALRALMQQTAGAGLVLVMADGSRSRMRRVPDESTLQFLIHAMRAGARIEIVLNQDSETREMIESDVR